MGCKGDSIAENRVILWEALLVECVICGLLFFCYCCANIASLVTLQDWRTLLDFIIVFGLGLMKVLQRAGDLNASVTAEDLQEMYLGAYCIIGGLILYGINSCVLNWGTLFLVAGLNIWDYMIIKEKWKVNYDSAIEVKPLV
jgi:hypothetical protein